MHRLLLVGPTFQIMFWNISCITQLLSQIIIATSSSCKMITFRIRSFVSRLLILSINRKRRNVFGPVIRLLSLLTCNLPDGYCIVTNLPRMWSESTQTICGTKCVVIEIPIDLLWIKVMSD